MLIRRRSHCRFVGRYHTFSAGCFIYYRLYLLPSGQWLHISGAVVHFSSSIQPPV